LLASERESARIYQLAYGVNAATMGMFALTIFYSLSLYARKRTEKYLLLLAMLSVIALVSAVSNSMLSLPGLNNIAEPVRFLRVTFCAALCPILMGSRLPGRWNRLYGWPGIFGVSLLLYLLYAFGFRQISNLLAYLLAIPALLACADGCARRVPYAGAFSAGVVIREALRIFYCFIQTGDLVCPPIFYYYYIPQMSSFIFVLACMLLINGRFADKFRQVDLLADKLETANTHLDEKVTVRTLELQCANERLTLEQDRKRNMMMNIFHDLRTPIFAAIGMAEKISPTDERSARNLDILEERLNFLSHLTEELFFLAKLEEGKITFERFRVRLDDFCPPIAFAFEGMAAKKGLAFTFSLEPGLMITGDAFRIKQALENLLSNAVKYTDAGRIDFSVCAQNGFAVFSVRDTGPGIPPEALPKLFERYYQGNLARGPESAGLGLSIVLAIAQGNGGEVEVRSEPGIGSCFMLKIPLEQ
jgi:signal transduction histidine kinase